MSSLVEMFLYYAQTAEVTALSPNIFILTSVTEIRNKHELNWNSFMRKLQITNILLNKNIDLKNLMKWKCIYLFSKSNEPLGVGLFLMKIKQKHCLWCFYKTWVNYFTVYYSTSVPWMIYSTRPRLVPQLLREKVITRKLNMILFLWHKIR